jgi:hypothetical protein
MLKKEVFVFSVRGIQPRALLGKCSTTELHPQSLQMGIYLKPVLSFWGELGTGGSKFYPVFQIVRWASEKLYIISHVFLL